MQRPLPDDGLMFVRPTAIQDAKAVGTQRWIQQFANIRFDNDDRHASLWR